MSYTKCTKGDDSSCTAIGGAATCCYSQTLVKKAENPTDIQKRSREALNKIDGWPKNEGDSMDYCLLVSAATAYDKAAEAAGMDDGFPNAATGETYKGMCSGAVAKASAAIAAFAAAAVASTY